MNYPESFRRRRRTHTHTSSQRTSRFRSLQPVLEIILAVFAMGSYWAKSHLDSCYSWDNLAPGTSPQELHGIPLQPSSVRTIFRSSSAAQWSKSLGEMEQLEIEPLDSAAPMTTSGCEEVQTVFLNTQDNRTCLAIVPIHEGPIDLDPKMNSLLQ
jgi:hypothetical protein